MIHYDYLYNDQVVRVFRSALDFWSLFLVRCLYENPLMFTYKSTSIVNKLVLLQLLTANTIETGRHHHRGLFEPIRSCRLSQHHPLHQSAFTTDSISRNN